MARIATFPPHPLYPILLGGSVNMLAGASGTGKTALIAGWARRMRDRTPINGYPPGEISALALISADRSFVQSTKRWFDLSGFGDIGSLGQAGRESERLVQPALITRGDDRPLLVTNTTFCESGCRSTS